MAIRLILTAVFSLCFQGVLKAQNEGGMFRGNLYNQEYDVFLRIDLKNKALTVPGHELYGPLAGYIGLPTNSFYWLVIDADIRENTAELQIVNDYGSEDLVATLKQQNDTTYTLTQGKGSLIKLPRNGKWMKLPKTLQFNKIR